MRPQTKVKEDEMRQSIILLLVAMFFFTAIDALATPFRSVGTASYYGRKFHGRLTTSGERFHMDSMTAAHRTLPFGTLVKVTHLKSHKTVTVRITDRGPVSRKLVIDLSYGAAKKLNILKSGIAKVKLDIIYMPKKSSRHKQVTPKLKTAPIAKVTPKPAPVPMAIPDNTTYSIQAGAYRDHNNAAHTRDVLRSQGIINTSMEIVQQDNTKLYRIMVGPFDANQQAEDTLNKLTAMNMEGFIVTNREAVRRE